MDNVICIAAGSVEYSMESAQVEIDDMISALIEAREDGATHIVGLSGNYRGAQFVRLSTNWDWADNDEDY